MSAEQEHYGEPMAETESVEGTSAASESVESGADGEPVGQSLTRLISLLVDHPKAVRVNARPNRSGELFRVRVDSGDLGQLIGRQGSTARALRTLLDARGARDGRRYGLEILES